MKNTHTSKTQISFLLLLTLLLSSVVAQAQPVITTFAPASGTIGSSVTITGSGFNTTAAQNIVFFGATKATVTAASATSLTVTVPLGATYQFLSVTNLAVNLTAYSAKPFIVTLTGSTAFIPKADFTTGTYPYSVSIGDLDGDGKPDLAVANYGSSTVSVLRNTSTPGTVSFATKVDFATGTNPFSVSIGEIDGDGKPELAVANYGSSTVSVLRNTSAPGTVSFATKVDFATGTNPISVSIGDIDGDGKPDLAVANYGSITVSVLRNSSTLGTVSFATKVDFTTGTNPISVTIGDIDGDGKPDLAVANAGSNNVSVLRNTSASGVVGFATKVDFATGTNPVSVSIGDIDGNGKPDLAVANRNSNTLSVLRNTSTSGTVSFATKVDFATGANPYSVSIGDIDGDGKPDLAVVNAGSNTVSVLRNTSASGTVSFAAKVDFATDLSPSSVRIGDIDGDGRPDITMANYNSATVSVIRQAGSSVNILSFAPVTGAIGSSVTITGTGFNTIAAQNIVLFGATQAMVTAASATSLTVTVPLGATYQFLSVTNLAANLTAYSAKPFIVTLAGSTNFVPKVDFTPGARPNSVSIGDIDGDGKPDLVVVNNEYDQTPVNTVSVLRNTSTSGTVSFAYKVDFEVGRRPVSVSIGDIDGDGKPDLAVPNDFNFTVSVLRNTSTSGIVSFAARVDLAIGTGSSSVCIGDIDGDGKPDMAVPNWVSVSVFRNTSTPGSVSFAAKVDFTTGATPESVSIGDIDGDGKPDLAVTNFNSDSVSVLRNTSTPGTVSFATNVNFVTGGTSKSVSIGDINGDGKPDLAVANIYSGTVSVLRNTSTSGTVSFAAKVDFATGTNPRSVSIGDIDGDGKPDLAVANSGSNSVSVYRNTSASGTVSFATKVNFTTGTTPYSVSVGDIDGDGKPDLAVANYISNTVSVIRQAGSSVNILSFAPATGAIGCSVTITGTGFNTTAAQNIVFFGATQATVTAASANSLTVTVPLGATYQYLSVTNRAVSLTAYSAKPFIVALAGNIAFSAKTDFTTGTSPRSVSIGDIDGDGKPELAVANYSSDTVSVLRNTSTSGTTSFATKADFVTSTNPVSVSIGDIDGDGKPDLAVANEGNNTVSVFRNTSTPGIVSFAPKVDFTTGINPISVSIGDIDGDGKPDLAVANFSSGNLSVLLNTSTSGTVSFATKVDFTTGTNPFSVSIGDIDGNGKPDLAVANYTSNTVSVLRNTSKSGTVSFATKVDFATGTNSISVSIGDIDGDGKSDLAVANAGSDNVSVLRNTSTSGAVGFATKVDFATGTNPVSVSIGDIDGDGKPDLALANDGSNTVSVLPNTSASGTVSFATKVDFTTSTNPYSVSIGDIDGDGRPDIAVANSGSNTVSVVRQLTPLCIAPTGPTLSASSTTNCGSVSTSLSIASGTINDATSWQWYSGSCGGTPVGAGTSVIVNPAATTTYFARGEGGCVTPGSCSSITITVIQPAPIGLASSNITASSAITKWDTVACAVGYKYQYRKQGVTTWTTNNINSNSPTKNLSGLLAATTYQWRVSSKFADGTYSAYSTIASFTTLVLRNGMETIESNNELVVYPNPAADKLNLEFPFTEGDANISFVNSLGQTVLIQKVKTTDEAIELNIQSLPAGLYFIAVQNGGNTFNSRFIKN